MSRANLWKINFSKFLKISIVFLIVFSWIFSGWPQVWQKPPIPPKIQEAQAVDISYVGAGTLGAATLTTDATAALPSGTQANDILLIHAWTRNTSDTTTVTEFTEIAQVDTGTGSHRWFWKRHDGSEGTATCDHNQSADNYCQMFAFRDVVTTGNPWNALGTPQTENGTTDPASFTGITTGAANNSMVVIFAGYEDNDMASVIMTSTDPSDYTEVYAESSTGSDGSISIGYALRTTPGATGNFSVDYSGTVRSDDLAVLMLSLAPVPTTALTTGSDPSVNTIGPGAAATDVNTFTLQTNTGTETVTDVTVNLSTNNGVGRLAITDNSNNELGFTTSPTTGSNVIPVSGMSAISSSATTFKVRATPKAHGDMPPVPGGSYDITAPVTAWTGTGGYTHTGSDTNANALTIDNLSPGDVTSATTTPGDSQITVSWTNPIDGDFSNVIVVRATSTNTGMPTEGSSPAINDPIGNGIVRYNGSGTSTTDTGLTNGITYYYKIWAKDTRGNYSTPGVEVSATPQSYTISCPVVPATTTFAGYLDTGLINVSSPDATTSLESTYPGGATLSIQDAYAGLYQVAKTIVSADASPLVSGTEGYGIQATTTEVTVGTLNLNSKYALWGTDNVGGLATSTVTLATSSAAVTGKVIVRHKATISATTTPGYYTDQITYSCSGIP